MDYTSASLWNPLALDQISRLLSEIQARKSSGVHPLLQVMSSQQLRSGHIWICTPEGSPGCPPSRTALGLTHLSPVSFLPSAKDVPGSMALTKQMQLEEAWVYPLCSITGYYAVAQKKKKILMWNTASVMRCGGFIILTGYKPGLGYKS